MAIPQLYVKRFFTKYKPDPRNAGEMVGIDYVEYGPLGGLDRTGNTDRVSNLLDRLQPLEDSQNPAVVMAHARGDIIRRAYDAWKQGREAPTHGTPLAAWNALNQEQVEAMIRVGIKTIEDVAGLTDASSSRLGLPNRNELIKQAQNFIDAKEQSRLAAKLSEKDAAIDALAVESEDAKAQIAELNRKLADLMAAMERQNSVPDASEMFDEAPRQQAAR